MASNANSRGGKSLRRWMWLGLGIIISVALLWLSLRGLRLEDVWQGIQQANFAWIIPGVAVYFVAVWVRTWRWHYQLRLIKPVPVRSLFPTMVIGYMGNNITSFRLGEVLRAYVLYREEGISIPASLATVVVERIFDGVTMLIFVFVALPFALGEITDSSGSDWLIQVAVIGTVVFMGLLAAFMFFALRPQLARRVYSWVFTRFLPERLSERLIRIADHFMDGLIALRSPRDMLMILFTSILIWLTETLKYWFVMHAFPFETSFFVLMLMTAVVNLAMTIPSAPGYIGTFDGPGIATLVAFGVPQSIAASYTLVLHAALWLPITVLGFWYFVRHGMKWSDLQKAETTVAAVTTVGVEEPAAAASSEL